MSITGTVIGLVTAKAAKRFELAARDPEGTQRELILGMVRRNAGTEYGKRHDFGSIKTVADYQSRVPVINYEDIREDMTRVTEGARNVFTAEDPVLFSQTSGTTGTPKYVPVTPSCQGQAHSDVMKTWLANAKRSHPDVFNGKIVSMVSPAVEGHTPSGIAFGSTSGMMYKKQNWLMRRAYPIPYEVFEIEDYTAKYYAIMRAGVEQDVHFLATANPSSILKMCEKADEFGEAIIRDIRDGALSANLEIAPEIRAKVEGGLRANPARAKQLEAFRERRGGKLLPGDYWSNLSLIGCWKGGTVGHYVDKFSSWFSPDGSRPVPVRDWGYLSSEARGSIPLSDEGCKGALTISSNFYEFVEVAELEAHKNEPESWSFKIVGELEMGKEYYIFVTTTGGLYRYDINDVVRVDGHYHKTPEIVFLRKGRGMTNLTGEKISVNQVIESIQHASEETGTVPSHFKAEADIERSRYLFRVEFATKVEGPTREAFLKSVDRNLKAINIEYKGKRDSMRLNAPVMHIMREGWYERGRRQLASEGKRIFQAKTEVLTADKLLTVNVKPELEGIVEMEESAVS